MTEIELMAERYNKTFPKWPKLVVDKNWIYGIWNIGNDYTNATTYYGAYPHGYLKRIMSLFGDDIAKDQILHLFSGSLEINDSDTFDINSDRHPKIVGDANELSKYLTKQYSLILADPPYSNEDAVHYGTPFINRNKVLSECSKVVRPNGYLVWLDQVLPMYRKVEWIRIGEIGVVRSTNHRFRVVEIFKRRPENVNLNDYPIDTIVQD